MEAATSLLSYPLPQIEGDEPLFVTESHYAHILLCEEGIFTNVLRHASGRLCLNLGGNVMDDYFSIADRVFCNNSYQVVQEAISLLKRHVHWNTSACSYYVFFCCDTAQVHSLRNKNDVEQDIQEVAKQTLDRCWAALEQAIDRNLGELIPLPL